jgi:hypothetical protein
MMMGNVPKKKASSPLENAMLKNQKFYPVKKKIGG